MTTQGDAEGKLRELAAIHTTDGNSRDGELAWDDTFGYGIVSIPDLLKSDPSKYGDENPLFVSSVSDPRCKAGDTDSQPSTMADCAWAASPTRDDLDNGSNRVASPMSSADADAGGSNRMEPNQPVILVAVGGTGFLIVAAILVLVLSRRRTNRVGGD